MCTTAVSSQAACFHVDNKVGFFIFPQYLSTVLWSCHLPSAKPAQHVQGVRLSSLLGHFQLLLIHTVFPYHFPPCMKHLLTKRTSGERNSHKGLVIGLEIQGNSWSSHSLSNLTFLFPPTCCYELRSFSISQGHQERQQERSFSHRDQKSLQTPSSDLSFVGKEGLHPPTVVGDDFTSEVSIIINLRNSYLLLSAWVHVLCMQHPLQEGQLLAHIVPPCDHWSALGKTSTEKKWLK